MIYPKDKVVLAYDNQKNVELLVLEFLHSDAQRYDMVDIYVYMSVMHGSFNS